MRKLSFLLCFIWMSFIFYMSSQNSTVSNDKSYTILNTVKQEYKKGKEILSSEPSIKVKGKGNTAGSVSNYTLPAGKNIKTNKLTARDAKLNLFIRKNAHVFLYLVLAALVSNVFFTYNYKGKSALIYIMFITLWYAVLDEFHQNFTGRASLVSDVLIDFCGSLIGIGVFYLFYYKIFLKIRRKKYLQINR